MLMRHAALDVALRSLLPAAVRQSAWSLPLVRVVHLAVHLSQPGAARRYTTAPPSTVRRHTPARARNQTDPLDLASTPTTSPRRLHFLLLPHPLARRARPHSQPILGESARYFKGIARIRSQRACVRMLRGATRISVERPTLTRAVPSDRSSEGSPHCRGDLDNGKLG